MKKILLFLLLTLTVSTMSFAQDAKETITSEISEAERIVDKYSDKVSTAIQGLAEALKVPAEHVYEILIKQQFAEGLSIISNLILFIIFSFLFKWSLPKNDDWSNDNVYTWISVGCLIVLAIELFCLVFGLEASIIKIINPEYGAIKEIFELVSISVPK